MVSRLFYACTIKALITANQFNLNSSPACGAKTHSGGLCKHKGNIRNSRCKRYGGVSTGPTHQTFGKSHHRYVHGLRTKEVIIMDNLVAEINKSLKGLAQEVK